MQRFLIGGIAGAFLGLFSFAVNASDLIINYENIPDRIRTDSPDLAAARLRVAEATGLTKQAGRLSNPELDLGLGGSSGFDERTTEVGISQRFPITSRRGLARDISMFEVNVAEAEVRELERLLIADARTVLVDVLAFRQQRELRERQAELSHQLAAFIQKYAQLGELSPIDAGQAKLEAARLDSEVRQLIANEVTATANLKPLLGMPLSDVIYVEGELAAAALPTENTDPEQRPSLRAAKLQAEAAKLAIELEEARRFEDIEAGIVAGLARSEDVPVGFDNEFTFGFQLKLPLPLWNKNTGNIQAAKARAERTQAETLVLSLKIQHEAEIARLEMAQWIAMLSELSDELLPLASKQAAEAERAYREGLGNLQSVLRAREQQLHLGVSQIDALRNFHHARVRFDAAVATL